MTRRHRSLVIVIAGIAALGDLYRTVAAALADFPVWMESDGAMEVTGERKVQVKAPK